jgi:hypothetical protein
LGNPPYVVIGQSEQKKYLEEKYSEFVRNNDLYAAFISLAINLIDNNWFIWFITPNSYIKWEYFSVLRKSISSYQIKEIVDFTNKLVFADANVFSAILFLKKTFNRESWPIFSDIWRFKWLIEPNNANFIPTNIILSKFVDYKTFEDFFYIKDVGYNYWSPGRWKVRWWSIGSKVFYEGNRIDDRDIPYIKWSNFQRYWDISQPCNFLRYNYKDYLEENDVFRFSEELLGKKDKVIYRQTSSYLQGTVDNFGYHTDKTVHSITNKPNFEFDSKFVLAIFNSSLLNYLYKKITEELWRAFAQVKTVNIKCLPFVSLEKEQQKPFIEKADLMLTLNQDLQEKSGSFLKNIQAKYSVSKITRKLEKWWELDFAEFLKETKISISLAEQEELMQYFETRRAEVRGIDAEIRKTDAEIDNMVFDLYGLTEEERGLILNSK